jgi:hypothetical protein
MFAWFARILGGIFGLKGFASGVMMVVLGVVLYNGVVLIVEECMNFAVAQIGGVSTGTITSPTITGFAGWFLSTIKVPESFAIMVSCVAIKFVLKKIPFIKW